MNDEAKKSVRAIFAEKVREQEFTFDDMEKFRQISKLKDEAIEERAKSCVGTADSCITGDCGYDESGGCNSDECCNALCDSCMATWDTCGGDECGVSDFG